jgi:hypothetical protein
VDYNGATILRGGFVTVPSSKKQLQSAWVLLRFEMRDAASASRMPVLPRVNALPAEPPDPVSVEPTARNIIDALAKKAAEGEASPTIRLLKKAFRPNEAEKRRRKIEKLFNAYLKAWETQKPA